jgi:hypothetical protein
MRRRRFRSPAFTLIPCAVETKTRFRRAWSPNVLAEPTTTGAKMLPGVKSAAYETRCEKSGLEESLEKNGSRSTAIAVHKVGRQMHSAATRLHHIEVDSFWRATQLLR